jgi:hypothetical protein
MLVPEARLELASLAAEDFESPASTIPPLGPPAPRLVNPSPAVNVICHRSSVWKVSQSANWPDCNPIMNQRDRCSEVP